MIPLLARNRALVRSLSCAAHASIAAFTEQMLQGGARSTLLGPGPQVAQATNAPCRDLCFAFSVLVSIMDLAMCEEA